MFCCTLNQVKLFTLEIKFRLQIWSQVVLKHEQAEALKPHGHKCQVTNPGAIRLTVKGHHIFWTCFFLWAYEHIFWFMSFLKSSFRRNDLAFPWLFRESKVSHSLSEELCDYRKEARLSGFLAVNDLTQTFLIMSIKITQIPFSGGVFALRFNWQSGNGKSVFFFYGFVRWCKMLAYHVGIKTISKNVVCMCTFWNMINKPRGSPHH